VNTTSPTRCAAWRLLKAHARAPRRAPPGAVFVARGPGVALDYSRQRADARAIVLLARLAAERGFAEWRAALLAGRKINTSEKRAAWHTALRAGDAAPAEVRRTLSKMIVLASRLRTEKKYTRIVNIGTGGSDLGPRLLADAFGDGVLEVRFAANADEADLERALEGAKPASTLLVVVSKTFTTHETLWNLKRARALGFRHVYAVTANPKEARKYKPAEILPMWDWVGGRYSVWSAAGFSAMCAIGPRAFQAFLQGGRDIDRHFRDKPLEQNIPVLMGLLGVWNTNFLGAGAHAVVPYATRLRLLPAYLQQLEMESNGKSTDRGGRVVGYATAPALFGAEGTPSQHSFHQLLHEGTTKVAVDFIDCAVNPVLSANAAAQAEALARGGRGSGTLRLQRLDVRSLGRVIALYEHKVFTQGVVWNLNSFDQPGVELGKKLAQRILKGGK
jgi:glucose-6-phosphate isomerase